MTKKKPVVGVMPLYDDEKKSYWMLPGYLDGLHAAGLIPLVLPPVASEEELSTILPNFDGFLFTGGHDIAPALYSEERRPECDVINQDRDALESRVYCYAYDYNVPVLGICRGVQFINVMQGGTLYQDLPTQFDSPINHHMNKPYDSACHEVVVQENTPLADAIGAGTFGVNSMHHQAVRTLGTDLAVMAVSEDGLTEGIYVPDKRFIWGVQWHPEYDYQTNDASRKIFSAFADACRAFIKTRS